LDLATREADDRQRDASQAELAQNQSYSQLAREIQATSDRVARTAQIESALSQVRLQALEFARTSAAGGPWTLNPLSSFGVAELTALDPKILESAKDNLRQILARRHEQVVLLRQRYTTLK
jgi:hypothetical protein